MSLLSSGAGRLVTNDMQKAEVLCAALASDTTSKTMQEFQAPETRGEIWNLGGGRLGQGAL